MHLSQLGRAACGLSTLLFLVACGGGGGGGSPNPSGGTPPPSGGNPGGNPPGPLPTFGVTGAALTFSAPIPNQTPDSQRIPVTISGSVSGKLYVLASASDGTVVSASVNVGTGQTPTVDVFAVPAGASTLLRGTYSSVITLTACVDD